VCERGIVGFGHHHGAPANGAWLRQPACTKGKTRGPYVAGKEGDHSCTATAFVSGVGCCWLPKGSRWPAPTEKVNSWLVPVAVAFGGDEPGGHEIDPAWGARGR
jgi:hypothetical protein